MAETQFKSPLFDASATWNGFSYQGKIGLYVCLKIISDALNRKANIDEFCCRYSIQFEWLEDFSILKDDIYVSHHQVKHYNEVAFSKYIDAFITIMSRQQGRISESDLFKYVNHYAQVHTKGFNKDSYIEILVDNLIKHNIVNQERFATGNKIYKISNYHSDVATAINLYLDDLDVISKQFSGRCIYVHTSKEIMQPDKDICEYSDVIRSKVILKTNEKNTLKSHNILCSLDIDTEYELALDDESLAKKLLGLAKEILQHLKPDLNTTDDVLIIYIAVLKSKVDEYIKQRHQNLSNPDAVRLTEKIKQKLSFSEILELLKMEIIDESKDEYWELICRENFENAFQKQIDSLDEENLAERNNLNRHYKTTYERYIKQGRLVFLLKELKPHLSIDRQSNKSNYYQQQIAAENDISAAFLNFLENLHIEHDDCLLFAKNGKHFQASTISVNNSNKRVVEQAITALKIDFKNEFIYLNKDTDFIVIDSPNNTSFSGRLEKFVEVPNVLNYKVIDEPHITSTKDITFVHYVLAQEKLNE
ncbi:hypothetical protein [Serratia nevei]|uniref:hypothetical protein n=1 Tax=Serratia nevei TaxID=2703794 RepID=UPI003FA7E876